MIGSHLQHHGGAWAHPFCWPDQVTEIILINEHLSTLFWWVGTSCYWWRGVASRLYRKSSFSHSSASSWPSAPAIQRYRHRKLPRPFKAKTCQTHPQLGFLEMKSAVGHVNVFTDMRGANWLNWNSGKNLIIWYINLYEQLLQSIILHVATIMLQLKFGQELPTIFIALLQTLGQGIHGWHQPQSGRFLYLDIYIYTYNANLCPLDVFNRFHSKVVWIQSKSFWAAPSDDSPRLWTIFSIDSFFFSMAPIYVSRSATGWPGSNGYI